MIKIQVVFPVILLVIQRKSSNALKTNATANLKNFCDNSTARKWSESTETCLEYFPSPASTFRFAEQACARDAPTGTTGRLARISHNESLIAANDLGATGWIGANRSIPSCTETTPEDCAQIKIENSSAVTGIYMIRLMTGYCDDMLGSHSQSGICCVEVYCEMDRFGGGWTVFQKRLDGSVDFYRNWTVYETGFGSPYTEFYAEVVTHTWNKYQSTFIQCNSNGHCISRWTLFGNKFLHHFTGRKTYELLVELEQSDVKCKIYAQYASFSIGDTLSEYRLSLGLYSDGTAGDSLAWHNGMLFSTYDNDNDLVGDGNCAVMDNGGWWYNRCHNANLNGMYLDGCSNNYGTEMPWKTARGYYYSFKGCEMKLRPVNYSLQNSDEKAQLCPADYVFTPCPHDCQWGQWGEWGSCHALTYSAIHGEMVRTRNKIYPSQTFQILDCQGQSLETRFCDVSHGTALPDCTGSSPADCSEIKQQNSSAPTGIYTIKLKDGTCDGVLGTETGGRCCVPVFCDMDRFGGGWTVFQKRYDGSTDFYQGWAQYEVGFGSLSEEFYAGNGFLYQFSNRKVYELLVELDQSAERCKVYAQYYSFSVADGTEKYKLQLGNYTDGTAGDVLYVQNGQNFSTYDQDNDIYPFLHCALRYKVAWWHSKCHWSGLNGEYIDGCTNDTSLHARGITWRSSRAFQYSFKGSEMKLRPAGFSLHNPKVGVKQLCAEDYVFTPCPLDCNWNQWGEWGPCTTEENSSFHGTTIRRRNTTSPGNLGMACQGQDWENKFCNMPDTAALSDWKWVENDLVDDDVNSSTVVLENFLQSSSFSKDCMIYNSNTFVFEAKTCQESYGRLCEYYKSPVEPICEPEAERPVEFLLHSVNYKPSNKSASQMEFGVDLLCTRFCWLTCCTVVAYNSQNSMCYTYTGKIDELPLIPDAGTSVFVKQIS